MGDAAGKVQELSGPQDMRTTFGRDVDGALNALNSDFPRHAVWWQRTASQENQAHDFEVRGLEQRDCLLVRQASTKRPNLYGLARLCMRNCHGLEYARAVASDAQRSR